jgi:hypothetical protein
MMHRLCSDQRLCDSHLSLACVIFLKVEPQGFTEAPIGQATAYPKLVDKDGPGGSVKTAPESTVEAYAKIGSLFVAAALVTWFGVPLLAAVTEKALHWF